MEHKIRTLIYGYGNPGRRDDGLGPMLIDKIEKWVKENNITDIAVDSNYQLNIEDAYTIRNYDIVIFVDASVEDIEHFIIDRVEPDSKVAFNTHSVSPGFVLELCRKFYKKYPETFLVHIKGYEFELQEGLTDEAAGNLEIVYNFLINLLAVPENYRLLGENNQNALFNSGSETRHVQVPGMKAS
jgi:hydrogenase maturation protease